MITKMKYLLALLLLPLSAYAIQWGSVLSSVAIQREVTIRANTAKKGVTAPSDTTIGTTPTITVVQFSAVAQTISAYISFPADMDKTAAMSIHLEWGLAVGETNGDSMDWTIDYTVPIEGTTGAGIAKTSTQITGSTTVTTAAGLAAGDVYTTELTVTPGDATNPTANGRGIAIELHMTNLTGVGTVNLHAVHLHYTGKY